MRDGGIEKVLVIYPNNDPGSRGIIRAWEKRRAEITYLLKDTPREVFLGLMRDTAVLIGNSSSGIIEAASFGTPVLNIGPRQRGRERSDNVVDVSYQPRALAAALESIWDAKSHRQVRNVYSGKSTGKSIAQILAKLDVSAGPNRKLITY